MVESAKNLVDSLKRAPLMRKRGRSAVGSVSKSPVPEYLKASTRRAVLFAEYYLQGNSQYKSALLAGFSESIARGASNALMQNKTVMRILKERAQESFERLRLTTDHIIVETAKLAFSNILDYGDVDEKGDFKVNLNIVNRDMGAAIQELSYDVNGRLKIKLADKRPAQELMMRYFKLLNDKNDNNNEGTKPLTISSLDNLIASQVNVTQITNNYNEAPVRSQLQDNFSVARERLQLPDTIVAE
jgi:phage terminase small subunit